MRTTALPAIAVAAVLLLAGCAGIPGTGGSGTPGSTTVACIDDGGPSPDAFPAASAIDESVFDSHAALLENTSFTVRIEKTEKRTHPQPPPKFGYLNSTERVLVEPGDSQYLAQPLGTVDFLGATGVRSQYSDGSSTYQLLREDNESTVTEKERIPAIYNASSDRHLWGSWERHYWVFPTNVTFERTCIETFQGEAVMRYDATGVDALPERYWSRTTEFSSTLRVDADGVIRYYRYEINQTIDGEVRDNTQVYIVSDVGSTDVEEPDWVANATAGS